MSAPSTAGRSVRHLLASARSTVKALIKRVVVVRIRSGPAATMRIGLHLASNNYRRGDIERPVQDAIAGAMFPGAVFFDVGANVGFFTLVAAGSVDGAATLVAFEPRSAVARALERNARRNDIDVDVWDVAVGDTRGPVDLLVAEHPGGSTIEPTRAINTAGVSRVEQIAIDELVSSGRLPAPDVVKIDVEGAEPAVVRGMAGILREARPVVIFEIDDAEAEDAETQYAEVEHLLSEAGYETTRLEPSYQDAGWTVIHAAARPVADVVDAPPR